MESVKLDTTTALTVVIPHKFHQKINEVRQELDKAYPRWMPHINLFFPFVSEDQFEHYRPRIEQVLHDLPPFEIQLQDIGYFTQKNQITFHVKPSQYSEGGLQTLYNHLRQVLPEIPVNRKEFHPHLTLAQCPKKDLESTLSSLKEWWGKGISFNLDQICLISRPKDGQFEVKMELELTGRL